MSLFLSLLKKTATTKKTTKEHTTTRAAKRSLRPWNRSQSRAAKDGRVVGKEHREGEKRRRRKTEVLTESIKNEAERAETHARLRHEVRIDIAEDAKVSWYFEMLDDVGKMGRCSDGSETSNFEDVPGK